jgi:hypothetical protein
MKKFLGIGTLLLILGLTILVVACGSKDSSVSSATQVNKGTAVKLVFTVQPAGGTAGSAFDTQPLIAVEDAGGKVVTGYRGTLSLTITPGSGSAEARMLGGTTTSFKNGTVDFKTLSIDKAGVGYTLTASSGNLESAISAPFTILPGKPAKLVFKVQTSGGKVGTPLTPSPEVIVQDSYGNIINDFDGSVSLSGTVTYPNFSNDQYGSQPTTQVLPVKLSGTTTVRAINGIARFTDVSSTLAGEKFILKAASESLDSATGAYFEMLPGDPSKLEFSVLPSGAIAGTPFDSQPKVVILDLYGNVVTSSRAFVTVTLTPGSGTVGAVLSGTTSVEAKYAFGGLAEFSDLSIDLVGSGYKLTAVINGVPSVTSEPFDVTAPPENPAGN